MWLCPCVTRVGHNTSVQTFSVEANLPRSAGGPSTMKIENSIFKAATKIWNYMLMNHEIRKSDVILALGNNDVRTAQHAAHLFKEGLADWLMFSGKDGTLTTGKWDRPEAEVFRDVALSAGVPDNKIILETEATNTGENVVFSHTVLESLNIKPKKIILVSTPYMERRAYATFMKQFQGATSMDVVVTSPEVTLQAYPNKEVGSLNEIISVMMGCMQRCRVYPEKGFQIPQDIPNDVWEAYESLRDLGCFNSNLI
ncbi:uncharacterized protein SCO4629-like [Haliotis rubra]|uniref:uncharacterized protein SCO4629-like n=1 Tax=Haliotis rubra TaxID=36100 RepID=UPI001EE5C12B|nr:uncharacterized protein SCO4629-like [Haliotis rubra]